MELLSVADKDIIVRGYSEDGSLDIDESELLHLEQSTVTIAWNMDDQRSTSDVKKRTTTTQRLKKRTSVDVLPSFTQRPRTSTPKISKTASVGDSVEIPATFSGSPGDTWPMAVLPPGELRVSSSDSHLSGLAKLHSSAGGPDPMISMIDHDINSPPMMFTSDSGVEIPAGFPSLDTQPSTYILPGCETMAVDIGMSFDFFCLCFKNYQ